MSSPVRLDMLAGWSILAKRTAADVRHAAATENAVHSAHSSSSAGAVFLKPSREQFEKLALDQLDTLYRIARRLARDPQRAEDLVQETYLRAVRARETFDLKSHGIRPW